MSKVDFQELLNEEIVVKGKNKNNEILIEVLEKRVKDDHKSFLDEFNEILVRDIKENKTIQDKVSENIKAEKEENDGSDILISDMIRADEEKSKGKGLEEESIVSANLGEEVSEEEIEAKYENEDLSNSQKAYAYIYEKALEEYFRLKINIERQNVKKGELSADDRNFLKLMRLKEVATRAELWFKNSTHGSYVGEKIESIGEMEKSYTYEVKEYQKQNNRQHEAAKDKVDSVNREINSVLEEISEISENIGNMPEAAKADALSKVDSLNEKYIDLNKKLEMMTPNSLEMEREEERLKEQDAVQDRHFGYVDERKKRKSTNVTSREYAKEKTVEGKKDSLSEKGIAYSNDKIEEVAEDVKESMEDSIQEAIENKDYALAEKLVESYQKTLTSDMDKSDDKEVNDKAEDFMDDIEEKSTDDEQEIEDDMAVDFAIGAGIGAMAASYPLIVQKNQKDISGLGEIKQPEEIAEETALDKEKMDDVENISEGRKTNSEDREKNKEDKEIN